MMKYFNLVKVENKYFVPSWLEKLGEKCHV